MLDLHIDDAALEELGKRLGATEAQIVEARNRTIAALQRKILAATRRRFNEIDLPSRLAKVRVLAGDRRHHGPDELHVWLGARHISLHRVGTPRAYGKPGKSGGVKVGTFNRTGAFLAAIYGQSKRPKVWMRRSSTHWSDELWPHKRRPGDRGGKGSRFPVVKGVVRIDKRLSRIAEEERAKLVPAFNASFREECRKLILGG